MEHQIPIDEYIAQYVKLRDTKKVIEKEQAAALEPYNQALEAIEAALLVEMNRLGLDSLKSKEAGTAFKKDAVSVTCADRDSWMRWVIGGQQWQFLTNHISKEAMEAFLEEHNGEPPPGVDIRRVVKVQIRRPS